MATIGEHVGGAPADPVGDAPGDMVLTVACPTQRGIVAAVAAGRFLHIPSAAEVEADRARVDAPDSPEALFEAAAARVELGDRTEAARLWLDLIARFPESSLVAVARRNLQSLQ